MGSICVWFVLMYRLHFTLLWSFIITLIKSFRNHSTLTVYTFAQKPLVAVYLRQRVVYSNRKHRNLRFHLLIHFITASEDMLTHTSIPLKSHTVAIRHTYWAKPFKYLRLQNISGSIFHQQRNFFCLLSRFNATH